MPKFYKQDNWTSSMYIILCICMYPLCQFTAPVMYHFMYYGIINYNLVHQKNWRNTDTKLNSKHTAINFYTSSIHPILTISHQPILMMFMYIAFGQQVQKWYLISSSLSVNRWWEKFLLLIFWIKENLNSNSSIFKWCI